MNRMTAEQLLKSKNCIVQIVGHIVNKVEPVNIELMTLKGTMYCDEEELKWFIGTENYFDIQLECIKRIKHHKQFEEVDWNE